MVIRKRIKNVIQVDFIDYLKLSKNTDYFIWDEKIYSIKTLYCKYSKDFIEYHYDPKKRRYVWFTQEMLEQEYNIEFDIHPF